jgi:hypothetical protein
MVGAESGQRSHIRGDVSRTHGSCDDDLVKRLGRIVLAMTALATVMMTAVPAATTSATPPPSTVAPSVTNDLLPDNNDVTNCVGTVEQANCGSRARADGHTYLVFLALALGLTFIGWRIARGVRARDNARQAMP